MSVIPDAIEPIEGWKAWKVSPDGHLVSSYNNSVWEPREEFCARCIVIRPARVVWQPVPWWDVPEPEPSYPMYGSTGPTGPAVALMAYSMTAVATSVPGYVIPDPPEPKTVLPPGLHWRKCSVLDPEHAAPYEHCSCGVYIAADRHTAQSYGEVLGKVKGWGTVVQHSSGWRVEKAYPSELFVPEGLEIADYGVPVTIVPSPSVPARIAAVTSETELPWGFLVLCFLLCMIIIISTALIVSLAS